MGVLDGRQLVSCIRNTKEVGYTRLFFRWEGQDLMGTEWTPKGIFHRAEPSSGESPGYLQAPHTVVMNGVYHMFYNSGAKIFCMTSEDGKSFQRRRNKKGSLVVVSGCGRDLNIVNVNGLWHLYYVGSDGDMCRMSPDLDTWTDPIRVTCGPFESPFLVRRADTFYLFVSSRGQKPLGRVYRSSDPLDFGAEDERHLISSVFEPPHVASEIVQHEGRYYLWSQKWVYYSKDLLDFSGPVIADMANTGGKGYAPEIILHEGQYYFAGYGRGIWLGKMKWVKKTSEEITNWRIENYDKYRPRTPEEKAIGSAKVRRWRETEGKRAKERAVQEWKAKQGSDTRNRSREK
jgi:hypothetical protein